MANKELELNRLRQLKQYKGFSDKELEEVIDSRPVRYGVEKLEVEDLFTDDKDKKLAKTLAIKYLKDFTLENIADRNTLRQLIQLEVLNVNLQRQLNSFHDGTSKKPGITLNNLITAIHTNISEISTLKDRLGMDKAKREALDSKGVSAFEILKKKAEIWRAENVGSRTISCGHCGKMLLLKIRTDKYDVQKHPFFKDKVLYNEHLLNLLAQGKITREDIAKILDCSVFYVNWLIEKFPKARATQVVDPSQLEFEFIKT